MAWVERRITRTSQPQDACGIDWTNPITKGLILADGMPQIGGSPNLVEPAYSEFISGTVANAFKPNGRGISTAASTTSLKSYGLVGQIAPPLTLMAIYRVYATGTSRNVGNLSASNYGYGLASTTNYRGILSRSGANTILTGSAVVIGLSKTDFLTADATNAEFWENGSRTAGPTAHGGVAAAIGAFRIGADNAPAAAANQEIFATALWTRKLAAFEIKSLTDNPWQIFEPEVSRIWVDDYVSAGGGATVIPIGVQATGSVGTPSATGAATAIPVGVSATASVGTPVAVGGASIPATVLPAGVQATGAVGTVSARGAAVAQPVGVTATGAVGTPVAIAGASIPATVLPAGVQASSAVGTPAAQGAAIAQPLGVAVIGYVGTPTIATGVSGVAVAYPSGVATIGQVGTLIATGAAWTAAVGVQAVASVGTPNAYAGEIVLYVAGAQTRPSRLQSSSRPSRLQTGTRASR